MTFVEGSYLGGCGSEGGKFVSEGPEFLAVSGFQLNGRNPAPSPFFP